MTETAAEALAEEAPTEWAIVEIFGHRRHAGKIFEVERFGAKMLRIDVPMSDGQWLSHFYGGSAIFSMTMADEATVMRIARPGPSAYALTARERADDEDSGFDDEGPAF